MEIIKSLKKFGLSEKEGEVYLSCLELGEATASDISIKSNLPRTLVYDILERLIDLGLVSYNLKAKKKHFIAAEPRELLRILKEKKFVFDTAFTNLHKRAIGTTEIVLKEIGLKIPVHKAWQLNERHYGALQGLNKSEMAQKYGEDKVHIWRRSYDVKPPALDKKDPRWPGNDPKYKGIDKKSLPLAESLHDTIERVSPYWQKEILPPLKKGKKVLVREA